MSKKRSAAAALNVREVLSELLEEENRKKPPRCLICKKEFAVEDKRFICPTQDCDRPGQVHKGCVNALLNKNRSCLFPKQNAVVTVKCPSCNSTSSHRGRWHCDKRKLIVLTIALLILIPLFFYAPYELWALIADRKGYQRKLDRGIVIESLFSVLIWILIAGSAYAIVMISSTCCRCCARPFLSLWELFTGKPREILIE